MSIPKVVGLATALVLAVALTACTDGNKLGQHTSAPSGSPSAERAYKIGLLLPDNATARYAAADKPDFEAEAAKLDSRADILYQNAGGSPSVQQQQAESMLATGVRVLVLDAVNGEAAQSIVSEAKAKGVPVVDYDRLVDGGESSYYVSVDSQNVGVVQATAFVGKLKSDGVPAGSGILMIEGPPTDHAATVTAKGAHSVIDASGYKVLAEYRAPGFVANDVQSWAANQIAARGGQIRGIYAANDAIAGGVIAAANAAKFDPSKLALTGQGATLVGIQDILDGSQYMTVYNAIKPEAQKAASVAVGLAHGGKPKSSTTVFGASGSGVPSFLLLPVVVTRSTIESTVVSGGFLTPAQICVGRYAALCKSNGIR